MEKNELYFYLTIYTKVNSRSITDLAKTVRCLEENIREFLHGLRVGKFLRQDTKGISHKGKKYTALHQKTLRK